MSILIVGSDSMYSWTKKNRFKIVNLCSSVIVKCSSMQTHFQLYSKESALSCV